MDDTTEMRLHFSAVSDEGGVVTRYLASGANSGKIVAIYAVDEHGRPGKLIQDLRNLPVKSNDPAQSRDGTKIDGL